MSFFRINLYLSLKNFFLSFLSSDKRINQNITRFIKKLSGKKEVILTSQLRTGFILTLKHLKKKYPKKNEIILNSYNLAEMVNICKYLGLKIVFTNLNKNLFIDAQHVKKKINHKTLAVVATNIFNTYNDINALQKVCKRNKTPLIEDNAIYFGNYKKIANTKKYSGSFGDYCLNSFNIMKNISAMYGGSVSTNDKDFTKFAKNEISNYNNFPFVLFSKQCVIYLILKMLKINFIYKLFFLKLIKNAHKTNNIFILGLVYPSIKFKVRQLPDYYFSKINKLAKRMILLQLLDKKNFELNHSKKKANNLFYYKCLKKKNISGVELFKYEDSNFQNFNDFPVMVQDKTLLVEYLFSKGVETKTIQYVDCQNIFKSKTNTRNLKQFENQVLCLPNHRLISKKYIEFIVNLLNEFYKKND